MKFEIKASDIPGDVDEAIEFVEQHVRQTLAEASDPTTISGASPLGLQIYRQLLSGFVEAEQDTIRQLKEFTDT